MARSARSNSSTSDGKEKSADTYKIRRRYQADLIRRMLVHCRAASIGELAERADIGIRRAAPDSDRIREYVIASTRAIHRAPDNPSRAHARRGAGDLRPIHTTEWPRSPITLRARQQSAPRGVRASRNRRALEKLGQKKNARCLQRRRRRQKATKFEDTGEIVDKVRGDHNASLRAAATSIPTSSAAIRPAPGTSRSLPIRRRFAHGLCHGTRAVPVHGARAPALAADFIRFCLDDAAGGGDSAASSAPRANLLESRTSGSCAERLKSAVANAIAW